MVTEVTVPNNGSLESHDQRLAVGSDWWARKDLNLGPMDYESTALTAELRAHTFTKLTQ